MKHVHFLTTAAALAVAGSVYGGVVIGDFENSMDNWLVQGGASGAPSTTWSSTGSYSLRVNGANAFSWALYLDTLGLVSQLNNPGTSILQADVHWETAEWTGVQPPYGTWARWDKASVNSAETGWTEAQDPQMIDPVNPSYPGSWDPYNYGTSHTRTIQWNFAAVGVEGSGIGTGGWSQLNISCNDNNAGEDIFYIDNIQLVPEPTSLALLGLGAALLVVRRRS